MDTLQFGHSVTKFEDEEVDVTTGGRDLTLLGFEADTVEETEWDEDKGMLILADVVVILGSFADTVGFLLKNNSLV